MPRAASRRANESSSGFCGEAKSPCAFGHCFEVLELTRVIGSRLNAPDQRTDIHAPVPRCVSELRLGRSYSKQAFTISMGVPLQQGQLTAFGYVESNGYADARGKQGRGQAAVGVECELIWHVETASRPMDGCRTTPIKP